MKFTLLAFSLGLMSTVSAKTANELYHDSAIGCADSQCHSATFQPQSGDLFKSTESLRDYIDRFMPDGEADLCTGTCASTLADWLAPELVGDSQQIAERYYSQGTLEDRLATYRRASILFAGELPRPNALPDVSTDAKLQGAIAELTKAPAFGNFIKTSANDQLLTRRWLQEGVEIIEPAYLPEFAEKYEALEERSEKLYEKFISKCGEPCDYEALEEGEASRSLQKHYDRYIEAEETFSQLNETLNYGLAEQPLELIRHVAVNDKPYSEILTADYLMMNPAIAEMFGSRVRFSDKNNPDEWRPGHIEGFIQELDDDLADELGFDRSYFPDKLPAAGVLTTPAFLARYPSTDTNRNRARARWTYYFFLGVDIEGIANRPLMNSDLTDSNNPTLNNPSCAMCHRIMDPVAATFQHWGNTWTYKERFSFDALAESYVENDDNGLYQEGDQWYRDMRRAGFNGVKMPVDQPYGNVKNHDDGVQWLVQELVQDERFLTGTVKFWWPTIMNRPLLTNPTKKLTHTEAELNAYRAQQFTIDQLAQSFKADNLNLRNLLIAMTMTDEFRRPIGANTASMSTKNRSATLATPEQLKAKYASLLGGTLSPRVQEEVDDLFFEANISLGGIDSANITKRARELSPVMMQMNESLAMRTSCSIVLFDLKKDPNQRSLFRFVDQNVVPFDDLSRHQIEQNMQYLYAFLLGEKASPKTTADLMALFEHAIKTRTELKKSAPNDWGDWVSYDEDGNKRWNEFCEIPYAVDWDNIDWDSERDIQNKVGPALNDNHTVRAWSLVIAALLTDPLFIHL